MKLRSLSHMLAENLKAIGTHVSTALRDYRHVASPFPSSIYTARRVARQLPFNVQSILEYGPGTGIISRELLKRLPARGVLVSVELNERFLPSLKEVADSRFKVVHSGVLGFLPQVPNYFPRGVDAVVSGIPFSLIPLPEREAIVNQTRGLLKPGGRFIVYQSSLALLPLFKKYFDKTQVLFEPRNILPYFILVGRVGLALAKPPAKD